MAPACGWVFRGDLQRRFGLGRLEIFSFHFPTTTTAAESHRLPLCVMGEAFTPLSSQQHARSCFGAAPKPTASVTRAAQTSSGSLGPDQMLSVGLWRSALKSVLCWHIQGKDKVKSRAKKSPKMWHCPLGRIPKHVLNDRKLGWVLFNCTSRKVQKLQVMRCERLSPVKHNPMQQNPRVSEQNLLYIDNCEYQDLCPWAFPFFFPMANWFFSTFGIYLMAFACCGFSVVCDPIISLWFSHLFWGYGSPSPTLLLLFQNFVSSETSPSALKLLETNKCI